MSLRLLHLSRRGVAAAALLLLAGCAGTTKAVAPVCPQLSLLQDAADLTRFAGPPGTPKDARALVMAADITAVPARCSSGGRDIVRATLSLHAQVRRGPQARGDVVQVPYFIAVMEGGKVLAEKDFTLPVQFRPNVDMVNAAGAPVDLNLPVTRTKSAAAYHIYVGFRLTHDELAYNRAQAHSN